jgi:beta-phosphoglucomutase
MIRAIMFDLDGTLVQSEKLKAQSYAIAAQRLLGSAEPDARAVETYREIVGAERHIASKLVMEQLDLESYLKRRWLSLECRRQRKHWAHYGWQFIARW